MRPLTDLLPHADALRLVLDACPPVPDAETIGVVDSNGRVLAEPVVAPADVPPFDRAAMDGYALRAQDVDAAPGRLKLVAVVHAGDRSERTIGRGECVQIATGAPLSPGTDTVVPVERTQRDADTVIVDRKPMKGEHVSLRGSDMRIGRTVLKEGTVLNPASVAVCAALGLANLRVWRRPSVTILSTGSELRRPGQPLGPGDIYDSNGPALAALFTGLGAKVVLGDPVPDDVDALRDALHRHAGADLILFSGGSSAGARDVLRDAVAAEGRIIFHGVRVKPGKPLLLAKVGTSIVFGLPGYPTSCLSDAYLYVVPALQRLSHRPPHPPRRVTARMGERVASVPGRLWFLPVRLEGGRAIPTYTESGATTSLLDAVGYIEIPPDVEYVDAGDPVEVVYF